MTELELTAASEKDSRLMLAPGDSTPIRETDSMELYFRFEAEKKKAAGM